MKSIERMNTGWKKCLFQEAEFFRQYDPTKKMTKFLHAIRLEYVYDFYEIPSKKILIQYKNQYFWLMADHLTEEVYVYQMDGEQTKSLAKEHQRKYNPREWEYPVNRNLNEYFRLCLTSESSEELSQFFLHFPFGLYATEIKWEKGLDAQEKKKVAKYFISKEKIEKQIEKIAKDIIEEDELLRNS